MGWNIITTADVLKGLTANEQALVQNVQGANSNLAGTLSDVILQVRGQIKAGGNQVDQSNPLSVPDQVRKDVCHIARWDWISSTPQLKTLQTPTRERDARDAQKRFEAIAAYGDPHREHIELPALGDATPAAVPLPSVGNKKLKHFKSRDEDGIV